MAALSRQANRRRSRCRYRRLGAVIPAVLPPYTADFTTQTLPAFVSLSRASGSVCTAQTGTSTLVRGFTTDQPRFSRFLDADSYGLLYEGTRTNFLRNNLDVTQSSWKAAVNATRTLGQTGPDGGTTAVRYQLTSNGNSNYNDPTPGSGTYCMSTWIIRGSVGGLHDFVAASNAAANVTATGGTAPSVWTRYSLVPVANVGTAKVFNIPVDAINRLAQGGIAAGNRDAIMDFSQTELGKFPTSVIVSGATNATRASERMRTNGYLCVNSAGTFEFDFEIQVLGNIQDYEYNPRIFSDKNDATTYAEINAATRVITLSVAGVTNTTDALAAISARDTLRIYVKVGGGVASVVKYKINAGSATTCSITGSALGAIRPTGSIDILCDGTGKTFHSIVRKLNIGNGLPSWAA